MRKEEDRYGDTRERLLEAAGEVFARCGFRAATVREISRLARANVAAVNYHFGDKEMLYSAVLKHTLHTAFRKYPPDLGVSDDSSPDERLHAFVRSFLFRILDEGRPAWHGKLMAREVAEPSSALDELLATTVRPLHEHLVRIVEDLLGAAGTPQLVRRCTLSVLGQILFYHHSRSVVERLYPQEFKERDIETLADHITWFSLIAMKELSAMGEVR